MYENDDQPGMNVFLRDEPDKPAAPPPAPVGDGGNGSAITTILVAVIAIVVAIGAVGAWFILKPEVDLSMRTEVTDTFPFKESVAYAERFEDLRIYVGDDITVADAGDTRVDWDISGKGDAEVHLLVTGPNGEAEMRVDWVRERDTWKVTAANFEPPGGGLRTIPLGNGRFLDEDQLRTWRRADESTLLGQGQREYVQGQHLQAIELFNRALDETPEDVEPLYWRGRAFEALNNQPKAIADYQRLLTFEPDHQASLARLDAMRASPPPGEPVVETPNLDEKPVKPASPVSLIPQ